MKTKNKKELINRLNSWLKKPGNSQAALAVKLGYSTSTTISHWLGRGKIPSGKYEEVKRVICKA
jgi:hypothetical protein